MPSPRAGRSALATLTLAGLVAAGCSGGSGPAGNTAPTVSFLAPSAGATLTPGASVALVARVTDRESPLDALALAWLVADGSPLAGGITNVDGDVVTLEFATGLPAGVTRVTLTATDPEGASGEATLRLAGDAVNEAPSIAWAAPADGSALPVGTPVEVRGAVADEDTRDLRTLALTWSGSAALDLGRAPAAPGADGAFLFTLPAPPLGAYAIRLSVRDAEGATSALDTDFMIVTASDDGDGDGTPASEDCDDADPAVFPGASEVCDGRDGDCDTRIDEDVLLTFYRDADGDGSGTFGDTLQACTAPSGYAGSAGDCDDANPAARPGGLEVMADGVDSNCDGFEQCYVDADGDGFVEVGSISFVGSTDADCDDLGEAYATAPFTDCADGDGDTYPGAPERCDGVDNDCDGLSDLAEPDAFITVAAGPIGTSTLWSRTDREYCLTGTVTVLAGVTLRVSEGVRIGGVRAADRDLVVDGTLELAGTAAQPIQLSRVGIYAGAGAGAGSAEHVELRRARMLFEGGPLDARAIVLASGSALGGSPLSVDGLEADCTQPPGSSCLVRAFGASVIDHATLAATDIYLFDDGTVQNSSMTGGDLIFWEPASRRPTPVRTLRHSRFTRVRWYNIGDLDDWVSLAGMVVERNVFQELDTSVFRLVIDGPGAVVRNNVFGTIVGGRLFRVSTPGSTVVQFNSFLDTSAQILILTGSDAGAMLEARENYWGTASDVEIQAMIFDRSDSGLVDRFVFVLPTLTAPHPDTPVP
jgi:hypothetical protein